MFFILLLLAFILIVVITYNSTLEIKIDNLDIATDRKATIKRNFEIYLRIIVFNKIPIFKINLKKIKNKKIDLGTVLERAKMFENRTNKQAALKDFIQSLKNFEIEIKRIDLNVELGTEDAAFTAISVGLISSILGIILKGNKFKVMPIYQNKNILKIKLDGIFRTNLIHYIYKTILKGRDKNERKSSDRRSYAYSNE